MSDRGHSRLLPILAAASLFIGVGMSIRTLLRADDVRARLARKIADIERLRELDAEVNTYLAAQEAFERLPEKRALPLPDALKASAQDLKHDLLREVHREAIGSWIVMRKELTFNDVAISNSLALAGETERLKPPWRLSRCAIRASPKAPGTGQVVLELEAISRE